MLCLESATVAGWTDRAVAHLDEILLDHAHCEKKAAGAAVKLLFRYPQHAFLMEPLARLAREELSHFEAVLRCLSARGIPLRRQRPSPYAGRLQQLLRSHEPARLVDELLCAAVIEARSCERFQLLAEAVDDPELAALYRGLLASEARHHHVYVELANGVAPPAAVRTRLREIARHEAEILREPSRLVRLHC